MILKYYIEDFILLWNDDNIIFKLIINFIILRTLRTINLLVTLLISTILFINNNNLQHINIIFRFWNNI